MRVDAPGARPAGLLPAGLLALLFLFGLSPTAWAQVPLSFVNEETTVRAVSFKFVDQQTFEDDLLVEQIATKGPGFWDRVKRLLPLVSATRYPFSPVELQKDVVRLRRFYERHGFLHPSIDYPTSQLDSARNSIHVIFTIREGPPLIIQDVGFYGNDGSYAYEQFKDPLRGEWIGFRDATTVEVGSRYTEFERARIQGAVQSWLQNQGFAFAQVQSDVTIDSTANTADIRFRVDPGPRAYVEDILIEGNETVSDEVLLRELPLKKGQLFSYKRMLRGQREIFSLNLFRVALADVPEQPVDSSVVVRYRVREAQLRNVSAQSGYALDNGVTLQGDWRHRNFMGGARQLSVSSLFRSGYGARVPAAAQAASPRRFTTTVSLRQPYLFTTHLSSIVSPFYVWEDNPVQRVRYQEVGLNTTLVYEIFPFRPISLQHTFSRSFGDTQGLNLTLPDATTPDRLDIYDRNLFSVSATLGKVDDFFNPKSGFLLRPFAEVAPSALNTKVQYYKLSSEVVGYQPLGRTLAVSGRLFAGRVWPLGESRNQEDPRIEARFDRVRFYAGGSNDVRGWPSNLLGPVRLDTLRNSDGSIARLDYFDTPADSTDDIPDVRFEPLGGLGKLAANLEFRLPFPGLGPAWSTAVFVDAGQVSPAARFRFDDLQFGVGSGIRYETLVGYIRLDLGFKVNPRLTDLHSPEEIWLFQQGLIERSELKAGLMNRLRLHLSIGQAF